MKYKYNKKYRLRGFDYANAGYYFITIIAKNRIHFIGDMRDNKIILSEFGEIIKETWEMIPKQFPNIILDEWVIMPNHIHGIIIIDHKKPVIDKNVVCSDKPTINRGHTECIKCRETKCKKCSCDNNDHTCEKSSCNDISNGTTMNNCKPMIYHGLDAAKHKKSANKIPTIPNNVMKKNMISLGYVVRWFKGRSSYYINKTYKRNEFKWTGRYNDVIIKTEYDLYRIRRYIHQNPIRWYRDRNNKH